MTGAAWLASRSGAQILPVAVFGQERIPSSVRRLSRARVCVRVAEPIVVPDSAADAQTLRACTDRVMIEVARLLPREYRGVYGAAAENPPVDGDARREVP
jgi:hypothetical protein